MRKDYYQTLIQIWRQEVSPNLLATKTRLKKLKELEVKISFENFKEKRKNKIIESNGLKIVYGIEMKWVCENKEAPGSIEN